MSKSNPKTVAKKKRVAQMKLARERKQLKTAAKHTAALTALAPIAKEINVRMEKAGQALDKADDHRLAAALRFHDARTMCGKSGIKFNGWCKDNVIELDARTIRELVVIGGSSKPAQALADLRAGSAARNKVLRAKAKAAGKGGKAGAITGPKATPLQRVTETLAALGSDEAGPVVPPMVADRGMVMVSKEDAKRAKHTVTPCLKDIMGLFQLAAGSVQMQIVEAVCEQTGTEITNQFPAEASDDADLAIPAFLDKGKTSRRKVA